MTVPLHKENLGLFTGKSGGRGGENRGGGVPAVSLPEPLSSLRKVGSRDGADEGRLAS
jgi:hypothetical protein